MEQLKINLFRAYYDARKNKRNTVNQLRFEIEYEKYIWELYEEIVTQTYKVGRSIAFIVNKPVKREIFAADFRDRVIHHLLYNYIAPIVEGHLIPDAYSCRVGKGTSYGIKQASHYLKEVTNGYTENAYVMKLDIQGYFMSINRDILFQKISAMVTKESFEQLIKDNTGGATEEDISYEILLYLVKEVVYNNPVENCIVKSSSKEWEGLPASKSLFRASPNCGLPIGNLTSQLFSNIYLAEFDKYVQQGLDIAYYGRYVDDFFLMNQCKTTLLKAQSKCKKFLECLHLDLHPKKIYLQPCSKGVAFLGVYIKPHRIYIGRRTKTAFRTFLFMNKTTADLSREKLLQEKWRSSINSYLGILKHYNTYSLREKSLLPIIKDINFGFMNGDYTKFSLHKTVPNVAI